MTAEDEQHKTDWTTRTRLTAC